MHQSYRKTISIIALILFLLLRVGDMHAFSHMSDDKDIAQCELCDMLVLAEELNPAIANEYQAEVDEPIINCSENDKLTGYEEPLYCIASPDEILNKPPPAQ